MIQRQLIVESIRLYEEHWGEMLTKLAAKYPIQRHWYRELRRLSGNTRAASYLVNSNASIDDALEQEHLLSTYWRNVWRISPEENTLFDPHYEAHL